MKTTYHNSISNYSRNIFKSNIVQTNAELLNDYNLIINGECIYIENFLCLTNDHKILNNLTKEIYDSQRSLQIKWSNHYKIINPYYSKTFCEIIDKVSNNFNVQVIQTRLNYYKDNSDWKPYHHDSHAYSENMKEDFTIGISLGAERELSFKHVQSEETFSFPQKNGDLFAFTDKINKKFMHGVPKINKEIGPRISIIIWGKINPEYKIQKPIYVDEDLIDDENKNTEILEKNIYDNFQKFINNNGEKNITINKKIKKNKKRLM